MLRASARDDERMDPVGMSERVYWANAAKRPGLFVGQTTLTGGRAMLGTWSPPLAVASPS